MKRTINFCGDSFCAGLEPGNWCDNLASRLGAKVVGKGKPSTAYEYAINKAENTQLINVDEKKLTFDHINNFLDKI